MRSTALLLFSTLIAVTGCTGPPTEDAAEGSAPPVAIPVGPLPGPRTPMALPKNPYGQDSVALAEGRRLFVAYNCYGCHGGHAGGGMGPSLRDQDWIYGGSDSQVFNSISEGRGKGMPSWGTKVPQDQIWKLVSYLHSLGTNNEPQPPE